MSAGSRASDPLRLTFALLVACGSSSAEAGVAEHYRRCRDAVLVGLASAKSGRTELNRLQSRRIGAVLEELTGRVGSDGGNPVHLVRSDWGDAAFKLQSVEVKYRDELLDAFRLQKEMGEAGYAPRVFGVVEEDALVSVLREHPEIRETVRTKPRQGNTVLGILMERIEGAWDLKSGSEAIPPHIANWNEAEIEARMREIVEYLNLRQIAVTDLQFLIDRRGRVFIHDFDGHFAKSRVAGFTRAQNVAGLEYQLTSLRHLFIRAGLRDP